MAVHVAKYDTWQPMWIMKPSTWQPHGICHVAFYLKSILGLISCISVLLPLYFTQTLNAFYPSSISPQSLYPFVFLASFLCPSPFVKNCCNPWVRDFCYMLVCVYFIFCNFYFIFADVDLCFCFDFCYMLLWDFFRFIRFFCFFGYFSCWFSC